MTTPARIPPNPPLAFLPAAQSTRRGKPRGASLHAHDEVGTHLLRALFPSPAFRLHVPPSPTSCIGCPSSGTIVVAVDPAHRACQVTTHPQRHLALQTLLTRDKHLRRSAFCHDVILEPRAGRPLSCVDGRFRACDARDDASALSAQRQRQRRDVDGGGRSDPRAGPVTADTRVIRVESSAP